jgi:hypothetical protein
MLDLGSTSFDISPEAAQAFSIPVVNRTTLIKSGNASGRDLETENLFPVPLGVSFGNHSSYNKQDHAFEVIRTSGDCDALIPAWYLEKRKARGMMTSHLHFPYCQTECYNHGTIHPEHSIMYDRRIALRDKAVHIGVIVMSNPSIASKLPRDYHKYLLLFDPKESEELLDSKGCDHRIEPLGRDD